MRNKSGPKVEPCGTPERIICNFVSLFVFDYQFSFPRVSKINLLLHKILIQIIDLHATLYQRLSICLGILL